MSYYDFLFAKGRFSRSLKASPTIPAVGWISVEPGNLIGTSVVLSDISIGDCTDFGHNRPQYGRQTVALKP